MYNPLTKGQGNMFKLQACYKHQKFLIILKTYNEVTIYTFFE